MNYSLLAAGMALCISSQLTAVLTKMTMLREPHGQSIIWLISNYDAINIPTLIGPSREELEANRSQIISLSTILGLQTIKRESEPLLERDLSTILIYRNPFKFKHLSPSLNGFALLIGALPFHSSCRGIDVEKREKFVQADYCFKNRTLDFDVTIGEVLDEYDRLEKMLLRAYQDSRFHEERTNAASRTDLRGGVSKALMERCIVFCY